MGIYDRDYMKERARDARKAEARKAEAPRRPSKPGASMTTIIMFWIGVLLLIFAGVSLVR